MTDREPSKADYRALANFRHGLRRFLAFSAASAEASGLTPRQHQALLAMKGMEGAVSVGDLALHLMIRHHSATELVNRLCAAGLARRAADERDRRRVLVTLTPAAERVLRTLSEAHLAELRAIRPALATLLDALARSG